MAIDKLSANSMKILEFIYYNQGEFNNQTEIAIRLGMENSTVTRAIQRLQNLYYVSKLKVGSHRLLKINKNKKREIWSLLRVYQNCKRDIESNSKNVLRVHDLEYYFRGFIPFNYDKSFYEKRYPARNRVVLLKRNKLFKVEIHLKELDSFNNTVQFFPEPFFITVPLNISSEELGDKISLECSKRLNAIEEIFSED